tara:strand:- start:421 stop:1557 length:1137 start_codon:yes stop_codon:yes gene_type:complete
MLSKLTKTKAPTSTDFSDSYYVASQWELVRRKFKRHKLARVGIIVLALFYTIAIFAGFFSLSDYQKRDVDHVTMPPQNLHFFDEQGKFHLRPFVCNYIYTLNMDTLERMFEEDTSNCYDIQFLVHTHPYKFWGIFETDLHLIGVESPGYYFPFGTDEFGRDLFSRNMYASRISLSIGFVGVILSFFLGSIIGGISGYFGGAIDMVIQRIIEFIISIPSIPLWIALAAALPHDWSSVEVYFGITIVLATVGWTTLARTVRGKFLELREADFVMAAKISNMSDFHIIIKHLLPSFASYLIVILTLSIPGMILGETALSFLEIGIRPPAVSWGVLLQDAQNIRSLALHPWLFIPAIYVIVTVLAFNFIGDGLRDAADPYKQ